MTNSRTKGKVGELEAAKLLRSLGFTDCKRGCGQSRDGAEMPDLINTGIFYVEVKRRKKITPGLLRKAWDKLDMECALKSDRQIPMLMYRSDREAWQVLIVDDGEKKHLTWIEFAAYVEARKGQDDVT